MQILCAFSSVTFNCDHFPGSLTSREVAHPVFYVPQKKLLAYTRKWAENGLTEIDSYLLFLAILKSSDLVEFRVPAIRTNKTPSIVANNMEPLVRTVIKLNSVSNPAVVFPRYVVSPETKTLDNVQYWIENWKDAYKNFLDGYRSAHENAALIRREAALERMIKNPHKDISEYSAQLANWAATAGDFPVFVITSPFNGLKTTICEYWKEIIIRCSRGIQIYSIPTQDLREIIDHCHENIPNGTLYSHALFKLLHAAKRKQESFLSIGDADIRKSSFTILTDNHSVEQANLEAIKLAAPSEEPKRENYPSLILYLKAKLRWSQAKNK